MKIPAARALPSGAYRVQVMVDGRRVSVTDTDPKIAVAKAMAIKAKMQDAIKSPRSLTVGEAIDRYIESKDAVLSPSTVAGYKRIRGNALQGIMGLKLPDLTQEKVQREINKMARERSPKTVRNAHGLLSAALAEYKPEMVLRTTLPQKQRYEAQIPSESEIKAILKAAKGTEMELPLLLAVWLGLRASEIRGLTWDCIQGDSVHIRQAIVQGESGAVVKGTKTYSGNKKLHIPEYIKGVLDSLPKKEGYIISLSGQAMYKRFTRLCKQAGLPHYRFHDLRHANASVMLALNIPDKYAMERMGHATNHMLKTVYQHTISEKQEEVDAMVNNHFSALLKD